MPRAIDAVETEIHPGSWGSGRTVRAAPSVLVAQGEDRPVGWVRRPAPRAASRSGIPVRRVVWLRRRSLHVRRRAAQLADSRKGGAAPVEGSPRRSPDAIRGPARAEGSLEDVVRVTANWPRQMTLIWILS